MELNGYQFVLAQGDYQLIGLLVLIAAGIAMGILIATHLFGPKRIGPRKHATYESGMEPIGDTRRRFQVRFYLIAVLFLIFDVEVVFLIPWAVLYPRLHAAEGTVHYAWAQAMAPHYGIGYMLVAMGIFFGLLLIGFVYEWRKGVFKWS